VDQPKFLNQVVAGEWDGSPQDLLRAAKAAEQRVGRTLGERWGPRIADADIIFFDDLVLDEPDFRIPHPGLRERRFVLEPLAELAPDLVDPVSGRRVRDLLDHILSP
jgi:2-amino-4-hydroxy-6-hydroxymethyldihydropteridine diphosphokinase